MFTLKLILSLVPAIVYAPTDPDAFVDSEGDFVDSYIQYFAQPCQYCTYDK